MKLIKKHRPEVFRRYSELVDAKVNAIQRLAMRLHYHEGRFDEARRLDKKASQITESAIKTLKDADADKKSISLVEVTDIFTDLKCSIPRRKITASELTEKTMKHLRENDLL